MPVFILKCPVCDSRYERVLSYDALTEGLDKESLLCDNDGAPLKRMFTAEGMPKPLYHPSHSLRVKQRELGERWDKAVADGVASGYSD